MARKALANGVGSIAQRRSEALGTGTARVSRPGGGGRRAVVLGLVLAVGPAGLLAVCPRALGADCNSNGVADDLDLSQGTSQDCNRNGIPDECDVRGTIAFGNTCTNSNGQVPSVLNQVLIVDLNDDDVTDVVTYGVGDSTQDPVTSYQGEIRVLLGNPDGSFQSGRIIQVTPWPDSPLRVVAGHFDGDGLVDLAARWNSRISVLFGRGDGRFAAPIQLNCPGAFGDNLVAGDFDANGSSDLATVVHQQPEGEFGPVFHQHLVFLADGQRAFLSVPPFGSGDPGRLVGSLVAEDLDHDGFPDLAALVTDSAVEGTVEVFLGGGDGTFLQLEGMPVGDGSQYLVGLAAAYLDPDDQVDLLVAETGDTDLGGYEGRGRIWTSFGQGGGSFGPFVKGLDMAFGFYDFLVSDLDQDGRADLATFDDISMALFPGLGAGRFSESSEHWLYGLVGWAPPSAGDFNGDGAIDVAGGNPTILFGKPDGGFCAPAGELFPSQSDFLGVCSDLDGNGTADFASWSVWSPVGGQVSGVEVLLSRADGGFEDPIIHELPYLPEGMAVADFNGDEVPDIATADPSSGKVGVLFGKGDGTFHAVSLFAVGPSPGSLAAGDFNGDGNMDLATTDRGATAIVTDPETGRPREVGVRQLSILLADGSGAFVRQTVRRSSLTGVANESWRGILVGDFTRDGRDDLVTTEVGPRDYTVLLVAPAFTQEVRLQESGLAGLSISNFLPQYPSTPSVGTTGDFNADGKLDVAFPLKESGQRYNIGVWLGTGGSFEAPRLALGTTETAVVQPILGCDLDHDDRMDLAAVRDGTRLLILRGTGDGHFEAPWVFPHAWWGERLVSDVTGDGAPDILGRSGPVLCTFANESIPPVSSDCNQNGTPDDCELAEGGSDCNQNGVPDDCDIAGGTSADCNRNGIPDECDIAEGTSKDCNQNGIADECERQNDCNRNDIPDECERACDSPVNLGFSATRVPLGTTGPFDGIEGVVLTRLCELCTAKGGEITVHGSEAEIHLNIISQTPDAGVTGWSVAVALEGDATLLEATTAGTAAALEPEGYGRADRVDATALLEPEQNGGIQGAASMVMLSGGDPSLTLPTTGTESVLRLLVRSTAGELDGVATLEVREGLVSSEGISHPIEVKTDPASGAQPFGNVREGVGPSLTIRFSQGGRQLPGDCNQDGTLDLSDAVCVFGALFLGMPDRLPCGDGDPTEAGNITLLDWQPDGEVDLSDGVATLAHLFSGGPPHAAAPSGGSEGSCISIPGCPSITSCP